MSDGVLPSRGKPRGRGGKRDVVSIFSGSRSGGSKSDVEVKDGDKTELKVLRR